MTIIKITFLLLTISLLTSCSHGYKIDRDKVYYEYWNEGNGHGSRLIEQADGKTFQRLDIAKEYDFEFGRDKNHLFIDGKLIKSIDPNTFQFIGNYIFRDKDSAYFFGFYNDINECSINGINPLKIKLIKYPWAKTDSLLIYGQDTLSIDNLNEFIPINENWGKTKQYIIYEKQIVIGADVKTFVATSTYEGKDKNYNYEFGAIKDDYFKETNYKTFDFDKKDLSEYEPIEFMGIYDKPAQFSNQQTEIIQTVEKLKSKGYTIKDIRHSTSGESKIISVTMSNSKCNCYVDKIYNYDYSKPQEAKKEFKITERIHCIKN